MQPDGGWTTPEVAEAQLELVERELLPLRMSRTNMATADDKPTLLEPYVPFLNALDAIRDTIGLPNRTALLDVGCGVGHYGTVCRYLRPAILYTGTDISGHMVSLARMREPGLMFGVLPLMSNEFENYPIVLLSQCVEVTDSPPEALEMIIKRAPGTVILHRLRLGLVGGFIYEPTYAGYMGHNWLWHLPDLESFIRDAGRTFMPIAWGRPDMLTMVLWPQT